MSYSPISKASRFVLFSVLSCFLSFQLLAQYPAGSPVALNGKLQVIGKYLRNECGNPVQLRGMASHGIQWFGNCLNSSSIDALAKDWNADVLRITVYIQEGGYVTNPSYFKGYIDNVIDECEKKGIYAIIDFHVHRPGDPMLYINEAREFWTYMSTKHNGKKHVIYEICNEPSSVTWKRVKEYADQVIPLIRNIDPKTLIVVGTGNWSQSVDSAANDKLSYTNIAYALHFYNHGERLRTKGNRAIAKGLPIFVTEFGTTDPQNTVGPFIDQMEVWNAWLYDNKISWANWTFSDKDELSAALKPGSCGGNWNNTTTSGTWVKNKIKVPADNFVCDGDTNYKKVASTPYFNIPVSIPGKIEAENYDRGVNGVAFRNFEVSNSVYRIDGVEVASCFDTTKGFAVGKFESGEWLNYTVNVFAQGNYDIELRLSAPVKGTAVYVTVNGINISGTVILPVTGNYYETITLPNIALNAGIQDMKIHAITNGPSINFIRVTPSPVSQNNRAPQVYLKSPSSSGIYASPASILVSAFANDIDGTIKKVLFYDGDTLVGEDFVSPYSFEWKNVLAGTHLLKAVAIDNLKAFTSSEVVQITVVSPSVTSGSGTGLQAQYFDNNTFTGLPVLTRIDTTINFNWGTIAPSPVISSEKYSVRWKGKIKPLYSESYKFYLNSDEGVQLLIDNIPVILNWDSQGLKEDTVNLFLSANTLYDIQIDYFNTCCSAIARLEWSSQNQTKQVVPKNNFFPSTSINLSPYVSLISPVNYSGIAPNSTVNLEAKAYDPDGSITKVDFFYGSTLLFSDANPPYQFAWKPTKSGNYSLNAAATDNMGIKNISTPVKVSVGKLYGPSGSGLRGDYFDNSTLTGNPTLIKTDPVINFIWLSSPSPIINPYLFSVRWTGKIEPLYSELYTFSTTSDDGVRLYVNNVLLIDNWTIHKSKINTAQIQLLANTKYDIKLEYFNDHNAAVMKLVWSSASQAIQVVPVLSLYPAEIPNILPEVSLTSPVNNARYDTPGNIFITANATDADGIVVKVEFFQGITKIGEDFTSPYSLNWTNVPAGTYTINAKATDNKGDLNSSGNVSILAANNQPPVVSLVSPVSENSFFDPATVQLKADGSDQDGVITKIEFLNGSTLLGEDLDAPYEFSWNNVGPGTYTITSRATDNSNNVSLSSSVTITVKPAVQNSCITEAVPNAGNWVLRNAWSDQSNNSGVFNQTDGMRVTHRAWGMDNVYIIQTGKKTQVTASKPISISFDFKNDISMPVNDFEIGFATGESSSGPILAQSLVPLSAGSINGTFSTKTINITPTATSDLYLTIRLKWGSQVSIQSNTVFRNIAVCPVVNARLSNDFPVDDMSGNSSS
ncbi:MAG: cellulase family glycosylhydrolase, partial [Opitutaceae bacterium]|nr:cellulase family glycosylhydrolase [Cytophagales bacterium]